MIASAKDFWIDEPTETYATLVVSTDKRVAVASDEQWNIQHVLQKNKCMLVLDAHGQQGGCTFTASEIDPTCPATVIQRTCDWKDLTASVSDSIAKAVKEAGPFSTTQAILGNSCSGATDLRAGNSRLDDCIYYLHEDYDHPNRRCNRLRRARSCGYVLAMGHSSRHPDAHGIPHPICSANPGNSSETYTLQLKTSAMFRTPAFPLPLLKAKLIYDLMSRSEDPADRRAVKGVIRFIHSLPKQQREDAWEAIHQAIQQF